MSTIVLTPGHTYLAFMPSNAPIAQEFSDELRKHLEASGAKIEKFVYLVDLSHIEFVDITPPIAEEAPSVARIRNNQS